MRLAGILLPLALGVAFLGAWEWIVAMRHIPPYVLPAPSAIAHALGDNFSSLMLSLLSTLTVTLEGFMVAWITVIHQVGGAAAAYLGGVLRIGFGTYSEAFVLSGLMCVGAALMAIGGLHGRRGWRDFGAAWALVGLLLVYLSVLILSIFDVGRMFRLDASTAPRVA